jgi:hypothetical protein
MNKKEIKRQDLLVISFMKVRNLIWFSPSNNIKWKLPDRIWKIHVRAYSKNDLCTNWVVFVGRSPRTLVHAKAAWPKWQIQKRLADLPNRKQ